MERGMAVWGRCVWLVRRLQRLSLTGVGRQATMIKHAENVLVTYCRYSLCKDALPVAAAGLTFLSLNKKVSKEVSPGEALTAKPFGTASVA